jgi:hypothetical protein
MNLLSHLKEPAPAARRARGRIHRYDSSRLARGGGLGQSERRLAQKHQSNRGRRLPSYAGSSWQTPPRTLPGRGRRAPGVAGTSSTVPLCRSLSGRKPSMAARVPARLRPDSLAATSAATARPKPVAPISSSGMPPTTRGSPRPDRSQSLTHAMHVSSVPMSGPGMYSLSSRIIRANARTRASLRAAGHDGSAMIPPFRHRARGRLRHS